MSPDDNQDFFTLPIKITLIVLATVSSMISLTLPCLYYLKGKCKQHPTVLIANISLLEALSNYNVILIAISVYDFEQFIKISYIFQLLTFNEPMEPTIDDFCKLNFVVYLVFELLSISYHICFSLDLFITLKSPFLAGYKRIKVYHVFAFLFTVIAIAFSFEESESTSSSFRHLQARILQKICAQTVVLASIHRISFTVALLLFILISAAIIGISFCSVQKDEIRSRYIRQHRCILTILTMTWICPIWLNILILMGDEGTTLYSVLNAVSFFTVLIVGGLVNIVRFLYDPYLFKCIKDMVLLRKESRKSLTGINSYSFTSLSSVTIQHNAKSVQQQSDVWNLPLAQAVSEFNHQQVIQNILQVILEACEDQNHQQSFSHTEKVVEVRFYESVHRSTFYIEKNQEEPFFSFLKSAQEELIPENCSLHALKALSARKRKFNMICEKNDTETLSQHSTKKKVTKLEHKLGNIEKTAAGGKNRLEIKVTSYAHRIFEAMRRMGEISFQELKDSLDLYKNQSNIRSAKESLGASGSFFFFSYDHRLVIKTIPQKQKNTLISLLPHYYYHMRSQPGSLLTKTYGLFTMEIAGVSKICFILMQNAFQSFQDAKLAFKKYDLKGSTVSREVSNPQADVLKDINYFDSSDCFILLDRQRRQQLVEQIDRDISMLKRNNIMDYSLLLGVSTRRKTRKQTVKDKDGWLFVPDSDAIGSRIYSLSLIDYLQEFDFTKYAELMLKRLFKGGGDISSVETQAYYQRFKTFVDRIIVPVIYCQ